MRSSRQVRGYDNAWQQLRLAIFELSRAAVSVARRALRWTTSSGCAWRHIADSIR